MSKPIRLCRWRAKLIPKKGSTRVYIDLFYLGEYYVKSTGYDDTPENRELLRPALELINDELASGTFIFSNAFPNAPEADKRRFSQKEGRDYTVPAEVMTFGEGYKLWLEERFNTIPTKSLQNDYLKSINPHILPFFKNKRFSQITSNELREFYSTRYKIKVQGGRKNRVNVQVPDNGLLSAKRMKNINSHLFDIWEFIDKKMKWKLPSPFDDITEYINKITAKRHIELSTSTLDKDELRQLMKKHEQEMSQNGTRDVVLFRDYLKVLSNLEDFYRPGIELITLTGMIASEMAAIRTDVINDDKLPLRWSLHDGELKDHLKTAPRSRVMPMTRAIRRCLQQAIAQKQDDSIFTFRRKSGIELNDRCLREALDRACDAAGVKRFTPYALRHSFVAYCEIMGIPKARIIGLMGHADKSMIDKIYGKYVDELEKDAEDIKEYFGEDFWGN